MKKELFEYTQAEAQAFMATDGVRELDYVQDDGYKLFAESLQSNVKLRLYEDGSAKIEIVVPNQMQCVPCGIHYFTDKNDKCPVCGTSTRDIMLRNKVTEEPFREFEGMYSRLFTAVLKVAQPLCAWIGDNFAEKDAIERFEAANKEYEDILEETKKFMWVFNPDVIERIREMKAEKDNVTVMRELTGGDASVEAIEEFKK